MQAQHQCRQAKSGHGLSYEENRSKNRGEPLHPKDIKHLAIYPVESIV
jgi:hypothetical protein